MIDIAAGIGFAIKHGKKIIELLRTELKFEVFFFLLVALLLTLALWFGNGAGNKDVAQVDSPATVAPIIRYGQEPASVTPEEPQVVVVPTPTNLKVVEKEVVVEKIIILEPESCGRSRGHRPRN